MIKDLLLNEGPFVGQVFLIKQVTKALTATGNPYLSITLQDNSGVVEGRKWSVDDFDLEVAQAGTLVKITGVMQNYKGHPQVKINEMEGVLEADIDMSKYVQTPPIPLDNLKEKLASYIESIHDEELRQLTNQLIKDNYEKYTTYPAAVSVHHAYLGGLLFHSLSICEMAIKACAQYTMLNRDYLVSGSLLHDIGKTIEFSSAIATTYSKEGNLLGHISIGAMLVYQKGEEMKVTREKLDVLTHMILSHHGYYEYGSPKTPMTAEAYVLHMLDELDSKLDVIKGFYSQTQDGSFTAKIPWLDNSQFYKPEEFEEKE